MIPAVPLPSLYSKVTAYFWTVPSAANTSIPMCNLKSPFAIISKLPKNHVKLSSCHHVSYADEQASVQLLSSVLDYPKELIISAAEESTFIVAIPYRY